MNENIEDTKQQSDNSFEDDLSEARELTLAVKRHSEVFEIDKDAINQIIKIGQKREQAKENEINRKYDLEEAKLRERSTQEKSERNFKTLVVCLIFAFLFFSALYFVYLGKDQIFEKVLTFIFGFLGGIGFGKLKNFGGDKEKNDIKDNSK